MRNLIAILAVLAMGVSAMADVTWVEDNATSGTSTMTWTSTDPLAGMALELTVVSGALDSVEMTGFNVFIDQAYSTPGFATLAEVNTNPVAEADAPGAITDLAGTFAVCGGSLTEDHAGVTTGTIVLMASEETVVDIVADDTRGGAVAMGGAAVAVTAAQATITVGPSPFEQGDINGDGVVDFSDANIVITLWGTSDAAGDVNGDGVVDFSDANVIITNWGMTF